MRGKILESYYDGEEGFSSVTKHTKYGTFTAETYCHPEDRDIQNEWDGCRFAEAKCDIEALREKIKMMRQRLVGMDQILDILDREQNAEKIYSSLYKDVLDLRNSVYGQIEVDIERYETLKNNYNKFADTVLANRRKFRSEN